MSEMNDGVRTVEKNAGKDFLGRVLIIVCRKSPLFKKNRLLRVADENDRRVAPDGREFGGKFVLILLNTGMERE